MKEVERMTDEQLVAALRSDVDDAVSFIDSEIAPLRTIATDFYNGKPFGDEEEGRSQVVMPVVRDNVRATMPSLMRVFFGGQRVVEFTGSNNVSAEQADQMTETVQYVFTRANPGFRICWDAFKDALIRKTGWVKWWWDDSYRISARVYEGVTEDQLMAFEATKGANDEVEIVSAQMTDPNPETGETGFIYKVRVITKKQNGQVKVAAVPVEEMFCSRDARSIDDAKVFGQRCEKRRGELAAMGISSEVLEEAGRGSGTMGFNQERAARNPGEMSSSLSSETPDQEKLLLVEAYYRIDFDGDGISELRRIVTVGSNYLIVSNEYADEVQFADFCPDPESHVVFGGSQADQLLDMQVIESHITRDMLDSLKSSIFPRTAYIEGQVNVDDILNTEIGAAIRMRSAGAVQTLEVPFVGQQALPILEWMDAIKEKRTGVRGSSPTLDAKALQSTNQVAVNAAVTGAQAQVELIARIFAETGMKRLFRGILRLLVQNQQVPMNVVIKGQPVQVDPSSWDVDAEISVNTALGTGGNEAKIGILQSVGAAQTLALDKLGLENPLCSLQELYNTQVRMLELAGMRDVHRFWTDPKDFQPPPPKEPEPTPEQVLAEAQMKIEAGKLSLAQFEAVLKDDRERDKLEADIALRAAEIRAKYNTAVDTASIQAMLERARLDNDQKQTAAKLAVEEKRAGVPQSVVNVGSQKPRKVVKTPVRDANGRIISVHEEEI